MEIKRIFTESDSDMISKINLMREVFNDNLSKFTAYDSQFNASFYLNWEAACKDALMIGLGDSDEQLTDHDAILIDESNQSLAKCCAKYRDVQYYAGKAFPDNKEALKEFGQGQYSKVCTSRLRMVQFMETLHGVADKYKVELIAQNFAQPAIDEIATLANELREDNKAQQMKKKERPTQTRKRIEALNRFYSIGRQVARAARAIYRTRKDLPSSFRLMQRHERKVLKAWLNIGAGDTRKTSLPKLAKKFNLSLTNQSPTGIEFWYANTAREVPDEKFYISAGEEIKLEPVAPVKKYLLIQNTSVKPVRVMMRKEKKKA